jgi:hypothetical protein
MAVGGACATNAYQRSGTLQRADMGVYATATTFLTTRGYTSLRKPVIGPVAVLERIEDGQVDRLSVFEQYRTIGQGSPDALGERPRWVTVRVVAETYRLDAAGKPRKVTASSRARAHADSLMMRLTGVDY